MIAVPTLDAIASQPQLIRGLSRETLFDLSLRAQAVMFLCTAAMITAPPAAALDHDLVLDVTEAARRLGLAPKTLQARARTEYKELLIDNGTRRLAFSSARIEAYKHAEPVPAGQKKTPRRSAQQHLPPELAYRRAP